MKLFIAISLVIICLSSCYQKEYVQLYRTKPTSNIKVVDDTYVYENDTIKVVYEFWTERGIMAYSIYNKLNVPIYLDWKKTAYVKDNKKLDYWRDEETVNSEYASYTYIGGYFSPLISLVHNGGAVTYGTAYSLTKGQSTSVKTKPERITFIAPHSEIDRTQFYLYLPGGTFLDADRPYKEVNRTDDTTKKTNVYYAAYEQDGSPLVFRNFLAFSTNENFTSEFYVDNGFYVSKISEMDSRHFHGKQVRGVYDYPFADSRYFYIHIDRMNSVEFRNKGKNKKIRKAPQP